MLPIGELASLGTALCWAVGLTLFRRDVREIGARAVNLFKGIVGSAVFVLCLALGTQRSVPLDAQILLALSGLMGLALGDTLLFRALAQLGPHRTALLATLGPVLTAAGGWVFLDEALPALRLAGIAMAVTGVTMVVYFRRRDVPVPRATLSGVVCGLLAAACQASGVLLTKRGLDDADPLAATALRLIAATAVLAVVGLARKDLRNDLKRLVRPGPLMRLVPAALIATVLGLWLMQVGIAHTKSAVANALHSTTPLFTLPIAVVLLGERVSISMVFGSLLAVGGVSTLLLS